MSLDVAFVTTRFGSDIFAGSEIAVLRVSEALPDARATVYSTTLRDFDDQSPRYQEGEDRIGDLAVRRYSPDAIDKSLFTRLTEKMQHEPLSGDEEEQWMRNCFNSTSLLEDLSKSRHDAYFFTPYLRATTYFGARTFPHLSLLLPGLHDEPPAHFQLFKDWFPGLGGLAFNSAAEQRFANHIYDLAGVPQRVLGLPVPERPSQGREDPAQITLPKRPFLLYVGRLEPGKGVLQLLDWVDGTPEVDLVVVGEGEVALPGTALHLRGLTESELDYCYRKALATCQLSAMESFSLVLFESWQQQTPVIVSSLSKVTEEFCLGADGGLSVGTPEEFRRAVEFLRTHPAERAILGRQGQEFTRCRFAPSVMGPRFQAFFEFLGEAKALKKTSFYLYAPNFLQGDAVGNYLAQIARILEAHGIRFSIHVEGPVENVEYSSRVTTRLPTPDAEGVHWFQYPGYYPFLKQMESCRGRRIFDFHGVTPAGLWADKDLDASHRHVSLAARADRILVHSDYIGGEILAMQDLPRERVQTLYLGVDTDQFRPGPRDTTLLEMLGAEGQIVLLYVGRLAANKRIDLLIRALARLPREYALVVAGDNERPEYAEVMEVCLRLAVELKVEGRVTFADRVSDRRLAALYRSADVFVSASLHEGFGMSFLEAMASGLPCVGAEIAAIPEVLAGAGLLFEPENPEDLVRQVMSLCGDVTLYRSCVQKGLDRARELSREALEEQLCKILAAVTAH